MDSQAVHIGAVETPASKMRTFLAELMEQASQRPAICERVRSTRLRLKESWAADHPGDRDNPFTQEEVARRVGVTLGAYSAWEKTREPDLARLRQIAAALALDEDYFSPTGDLASATARVEAEADRLATVTDHLTSFLEELKSQLAAGSPVQSRRGRDR